MGSINKDEYQAALGEFLVTFNQLENLLNEVIVELLRRRQKDRLYREADMFDRKLDQLELISLAFHPLHSPDYARLRHLNAERNILAHGHFNVDQFTGEISIIKARESKHKKGKNISPNYIKKLSQMATEAINDLWSYMPYIWFQHTPQESYELPPRRS